MQTKNFILKNTCDNEKHIPTIIYVTLRHKKSKKNISVSLSFKPVQATV